MKTHQKQACEYYGFIINPDLVSHVHGERANFTRLFPGCVEAGFSVGHSCGDLYITLRSKAALGLMAGYGFECIWLRFKLGSQ